MFGKAFIKIDNQVIKIKISAFDKEQKIDWAEINTIDYKPSIFIITKRDNTTSNLKMIKLEYSVMQEIKDVVDKIAHDKKISVNIK